MGSLLFIFFMHYVADFLLQTREMAVNKSSKFNVLLTHMMIYFWGMLIASSIVGKSVEGIVYFTIIATVLHGIQDWFIWRWYKHLRADKLNDPTFNYWNDKVFVDFVGMDGVMHFNCLVILYWVFL